MDARSGRRGLTNGLGTGRAMASAPGHVNGIHRATNGLVNGTHGRTNGLVNGTRGRGGLVNGTGAVNGSGFVNGLSLRRNPFGIVTHRDLRRSATLLALSIVAILVLGYFLGVPPAERTAFGADGEFTEWDAIPKHADPADAPASGDLNATAIHAQMDRVFLYATTGGDLFTGPDASSVYVLISVDGRSGYNATAGFAAAFVAEAYGWDGALRGTVLREWSGGSADADNASALISRGAFPAAANASKIEIALDVLDLGLESSAGMWFRFATRAGDRTDVGPIMGRTPGGLLVQQEPLPLVTTISGDTPAMRLTFSALAAKITVNDFTLETPPGAGHMPPSVPFDVSVGTPHVVNIIASPGALSSGALYTARVSGVDAVVADTGAEVRATITGDGARAYVDAVPPGHAVDGLFDDWANATTDLDDSVPAPVDIRESAVALQAGAFFYVRTEGDVMAGALLPTRSSRPVPGNGTGGPSPPAPLRRIAGEDVLRIYVDADDRDAVGEPFGGLLADRLVEVRGRLGRITATTMYAWNPAGGWEPRAEAFDVAYVGPEIEAFASPSFLGTTSNASVAFAMSDWSGATDETGVHGLRGTRSPPGLQPRHGSGNETIVATPLANVPEVDGNCATSGGEYDGASSDSNADITFYVGQRGDTQFVYLCVRVTSDGTQNALDWGELLFDRNHDGQNPPQDGDRRFRVSSGSIALAKEKGDGTGGWTSCGSDCDAGDIGRGEFTNGEEVYEFRIRFSDVWGTNSPTGNQQAGFAIVAHNEDTGFDATWGSNEVNENAPSTWGQIEIPEFPFLAGASVGLLALVAVRRRSRRRFPPANP